MRFFIVIIYCFSFNFLFSQTDVDIKKVESERSLKIVKSISKIIVDGDLSDADWQTADSAFNFFQFFPFDTSFAKTKTVVKTTYDDNYFYVAATCYDATKGNYIVQSLKRDFSYPVNDAFVVSIDCMNDKTNGFSFGVNPLGVQREGLLSNGGGMGVTTIWDTKWFSSVKHGEGKWTVEMAIPFKSLRYKSGVEKWRINFARNDLKRNENSVWSPVPRNFNVASLAFSGILIWDAPPKKAGANIALIPYITGGTSQDFSSQSNPQYKYNAGLDAKVAITSSLNLDLTINPDFAQVEVDKQVTNLTQFSIYFPERRSFFIENSDLFDRVGFQQIRPFFSRRIGLYNGSIIPIIGGFRLSGNINKNWRIGIMSMQTEHKHELGLEPQNFSVAAIQRNVFKRSNVAFIFVNKQNITEKEISPNIYNRIVGIDYNLQSGNNKWFGKFFYHYSITSANLKDNTANASYLTYNTPKFSLEWNHEYAEKNYVAETGFVPRIYFYNPTTNTEFRETYWRLEPSMSYKFYPKSKILNNHYPALYLSQYFNAQFKTTEYLYQLGYYFNFQNSSNLFIKAKHNFINLRYPVDVTFTSKLPIPNGNYIYNNALISYTSSSIKKLFGSATIDYGEFYNGYKLSYFAELNYRKQPWGVFSLNFNQNEITLPLPYSNASITLIGPKIELIFTKNISFTTFLQYNTQINNVNVNSRFQWRFKPMSDFYIVYTDNYYSLDGSKKNRALILKLIYWIGI